LDLTDLNRQRRKFTAALSWRLGTVVPPELARDMPLRRAIALGDVAVRRWPRQIVTHGYLTFDGSLGLSLGLSLSNHIPDRSTKSRLRFVLLEAKPQLLNVVLCELFEPLLTPGTAARFV